MRMREQQKKHVLVIYYNFTPHKPQIYTQECAQVCWNSRINTSHSRNNIREQKKTKPQQPERPVIGDAKLQQVKAIKYNKNTL